MRRFQRPTVPWPRSLRDRVMNRPFELAACLVSISYGVMVLVDLLVYPPRPDDDIFFGPIVDRAPVDWGLPMAFLWIGGGALWASTILIWFENLEMRWWLKRAGLLAIAFAWAEYAIAAATQPFGVYLGGLVFSILWVVAAILRLRSSFRSTRAKREQARAAQAIRCGGGG